MKIKFLKASNGDSILISYKDEKVNRNILVDGGVEDTYYNSSENRYGELKLEIELIKKRKEVIDLLILTHIDNDHICGLIEWLRKDEDGYKLIKNIWFNSGKLISEYFKEPENQDLRTDIKIFKSTQTGVSEGVEFENYLLEKKIWDRKIILQGTKLSEYGVTIEVLSPDVEQLKKLLREYKAKIKGDAYTFGTKKDWDIDIKNFIAEEGDDKFKFEQDTSIKNGSSISFILTLNGKNFLFLGDSHPKKIVEYLKSTYSQINPLEVEFIKVSHHGSKRNTNKELLEIIKTNNYIISTDSSVHAHPNKRTLARVIKENPNAVFHFNYKNVKENVFSRQDFLDYSDFKIKLTAEYTDNND
jgi:beta-lactamase superfamily II metal-dependent hydrolase